MRTAKCLIMALAVLLAATVPARAQQRVRVATYNIQFLNATIPEQRAERLRTVVERLDADVIALEEIADRAALERVFPPADWLLVIDDDSGDAQDLAVAVRKPFRVVGLNADPDDLDADDDDFLFSGQANENFFPNRRDLLRVRVEVPHTGATFSVLVVHAKSRGMNQQPARSFTEPRRAGAAERLMRALEHDFDEEDFVVLGDFNDNPDDRSLNILESGDPNAVAGREEIAGPFLINLCEPLVEQGHVSHGRTPADIQGDKINTIDPLSRQRNIQGLGTSLHTGDILFDQLLIPMRMGDRHVPGSTKVFDDPIAILGPGPVRASDHLPVSADFSFEEGGEEPSPRGVRIASLLANPEGRDEGRETITLRNGTDREVSLDGWKFRDRSGNEFRLGGSIAAGQDRKITLPAGSMPLNNGGDNVALIDDRGEVRHRVDYTAAQARSGRETPFD